MRFTLSLALTLAAAATAAEITGFYVVDTVTDETLLQLDPEVTTTLDLSELGTNTVSVYVKASEDTTGVRLRLNGGLITNFENDSPYALFADNPEGAFPDDGFLDPGNYRLQATPYARQFFRASGTSITARFNIVQGAPKCEFSVEVGTCDAATVIEALREDESDCNAGLISNHIDAICGHARAAADAGTPLTDLITEYGGNMDEQDLENYFNGGTFLNENTGDVEEEAPFIAQIFDEFAQAGTIAYPDHLRTFGECDVGAVVCVWIRDRQAGDDNGNCATPLDERCVDADPADNTDLCYADASRSPVAAHVPEGVVRFPGETEGDVHAHGFAFKDGSLTTRFKGNVLFFVSMYDHLNQRGYAENVPLAPMCGCVDQMPTISRADCTEVDVDETFRVSMNGGLDTLAAERLSVEIDFNACDGETANDLGSEFKQLYGEGDALEVFEEYLVGPANNDASNCPE